MLKRISCDVVITVDDESLRASIQAWSLAENLTILVVDQDDRPLCVFRPSQAL